MKYQLIVAMCETRGIGYKNNLPWNIPEDLKYFSKLTRGNNNNAVVMGKILGTVSIANLYLREII